MKKIICLLLISFFLWQCTTNGEKPVVPYETVSFELKLEGKKYDSLMARISYSSVTDPENRQYLNRNKIMDIKGISEDGYNWLFLIPDSLRQYNAICTINTKKFNNRKNEGYLLIFTNEEFDYIWDTKIEEKKTVIEASFTKTEEQTWDMQGSRKIITDVFYQKDIRKTD
ncbi:MAG: hypothetical protein LBV43_07485 [Prevotella sp.]|jgi:hypothetical protein|nr:hypothetical protein [Prevotella sp.]